MFRKRHIIASTETHSDGRNGKKGGKSEERTDEKIIETVVTSNEGREE